MNVTRILLLSLVALSACGRDQAKDDATPNPAADKTPVSPDEYRQRQTAFADSVLNTASDAKHVVERLGKGHEVGSVRLRDTVAVLAGKKTNCFQEARKSDPYLAGTVSFLVNINVIGSDVIFIQESKWTSAAGNLVDACLNQEAKKWKFDSSFGKPAAYVVQVQFK